MSEIQDTPVCLCGFDLAQCSHKREVGACDADGTPEEQEAERRASEVMDDIEEVLERHRIEVPDHVMEALNNALCDWMEAHPDAPDPGDSCDRDEDAWQQAQERANEAEDGA
jgi:hypothetical protein